MLISDPNDGAKSIGLLCFRKEDAEAFLAQVFCFFFLLLSIAFWSCLLNFGMMFLEI